MTSILLFVAAPFCVATVGFILAANFITNQNFKSNGELKNNSARHETLDISTRAILFHNEAIYKAFEFYIKVELAIFGGIGYLAVNSVSNVNSKILIQSGGIITIPMTILFCVLVLIHLNSKIIRWRRKPPNWYSPVVYSELWFINISITLAWSVNGLLIPRLIGP